MAVPVSEAYSQIGRAKLSRKMNSEITCSRRRYWDLKHIQRTELDENGVPEQEYYARCMNPESPCEGRYTEAGEGCEVFKPR